VYDAQYLALAEVLERRYGPPINARQIPPAAVGEI
jgi:hypothetical protein